VHRNGMHSSSGRRSVGWLYQSYAERTMHACCALLYRAQEAEQALLNKLDQQLETISTGRRDELQTALQVLTYNMMIFHGRSLSTISTMAKDLDKMWPQARDILARITAHSPLVVRSCNTHSERRSQNCCFFSSHDRCALTRRCARDRSVSVCRTSRRSLMTSLKEDNSASQEGLSPSPRFEWESCELQLAWATRLPRHRSSRTRRCWLPTSEVSSCISSSRMGCLRG
jgi:hypothetical protein